MPPITRQTLAIYCGASGDHNPIHIDFDFARESGLDDVIAHGMLVMAYMGRFLTNSVRQDVIRSFDARFQAMTRVGDEITVQGRVAKKFIDDGVACAQVDLTAVNQDGEIKAVGSAIVGPA
tara:strand:+ start:787 stop:1149 length:363 start_codon:yes stop_codon:yes gene_type:complete